MRKRSGNEDGLVVPTVELAAVIRVWITDHEAHHPPGTQNIPTYKGGQSESIAQGYSGLQYISNHLPGDHQERTVWRILHLESKHTSFWLADSLCTIIEEMAAFHDGRITVIPNPNWSQEHWLEWKGQQGCI